MNILARVTNTLVRLTLPHGWLWSIRIRDFVLDLIGVSDSNRNIIRQTRTARAYGAGPLVRKKIVYFIWE